MLGKLVTLAVLVGGGWWAWDKYRPKATTTGSVTKMPPPGVIGDTPPNTPPAQQLSPLEQTAVTMNNALETRGYVKRDMNIYSALQNAAGLTPDGFPGEGTISKLTLALASAGVTPSSRINPSYTFAKAYGFDGVHAPTSAQWNA